MFEEGIRRVFASEIRRILNFVQWYKVVYAQGFIAPFHSLETSLLYRRGHLSYYCIFNDFRIYLFFSLLKVRFLNKNV